MTYKNSYGSNDLKIHVSAIHDWHINRMSPDKLLQLMLDRKNEDQTKLWAFYKEAVDRSKGFVCGMEIEKSDPDILESVHIIDFRNSVNDWHKTDDSSIDGDKGFELISPVLPFDPIFIRQYLERLCLKEPIMDEHLNASVDTHCGFHLSISNKKMRPEEIFRRMFNWLPVLYALYPSRTENRYCTAVINRRRDVISGDWRPYKNKYTPAYIRNDRLELRIFPGAKTVEQIIWRLSLVRYMLNNPIATLQGLNRRFNSDHFQYLLNTLYFQSYNIHDTVSLETHQHKRIRQLTKRIRRMAIRYNFYTISSHQLKDPDQFTHPI